ncbi:hypothetical protein CC79DRAFT_1319824 [Sarocladium strictum]
METYHGYVRTPGDAIKLFEACRLGLLPRVQRRLSEKERQSIRSGSVFVWDEREAGMRRWTDGKSWSASRVSGSFLTYREMEGKRGGGFGNGRRNNGKTPESGRASDEDQDDGEPEGYRYKADGLMKQSFSITTSTGQHLHLISYYSRPQPGQPEMNQPSSDPALRAIVPVKGMYPESSMGEANQTPALTRAPMPQTYMVPQHPPPGHPYGAPPYAHAQAGYGWPPSPMATPPYHYATAAYLPQGHHQLPPPHASHYTHGPAPERHTLPPPQPQKHSLPPYQAPSQGPTPPRLHDSPRQSVELPQAFMANGAPRHGPLPALNMTNGPTGPTLAAISTPPSRNLSVSPPQSSHSDGHHKSNLSALLHHDASDRGSPQSCAVAAASEKGGVSEDARALRMLDRKFCI